MRPSCDYQDQNSPLHQLKKKARREKYNGKLKYNTFCAEFMCNNRQE